MCELIGSQEVRFSTFNWCVELDNGVETALCPQRITHNWFSKVEDLNNRIEAVKTNSYYSVRD